MYSGYNGSGLGLREGGRGRKGQCRYGKHYRKVSVTRKGEWGKVVSRWQGRNLGERN